MGSTSSKHDDSYSEEMRADPLLSPSNFPRTDGSTITIPTTDGQPPRAIGYAEYGDRSAPPERTILFMHGTPGTRFFFSGSNAAHATAHNVRVVVPERPGYGLSTPVPYRSLLSTACDAAAVLGAVGVAAAHVMGYSAGGPFALAFAKVFSERCLSVVVVSGLSPNVPGVTVGMTAVSKVGYFLAGQAPRVLKWLVGMMSADAMKEVFAHRRGDFTEEENRQFKECKQMRRCFAESTLELYSRETGVAAEAEDYALMSNDWGFDLEEVVNVDIYLYGGGRDNKCTPAMFRELERGLSRGRVTAQFAEQENHLYFYRLFEGSLFSDIGLLWTLDLRMERRVDHR